MILKTSSPHSNACFCFTKSQKLPKIDISIKPPASASTWTLTYEQFKDCSWFLSSLSQCSVFLFCCNTSEKSVTRVNVCVIRGPLVLTFGITGLANPGCSWLSAVVPFRRRQLFCLTYFYISRRIIDPAVLISSVC